LPPAGIPVALCASVIQLADAVGLPAVVGSWIGLLWLDVLAAFLVCLVATASLAQALDRLTRRGVRN